MVPQVLKCDEIIWSSTRTGRYSTNTAWLAMRDRHRLVHRHKLIWFPLAIPKYGFILWLAIRERLALLIDFMESLPVGFVIYVTVRWNPMTTYSSVVLIRAKFGGL